MAWTTPGTAVAGEVLTAAYLNTYVRDNLNAIRLIQINAVMANGSAASSTGGTPQQYMTVGITPTSATSKILILSSATMNAISGASNRTIQSDLLRGATLIDRKQAGQGSTTSINHNVCHVYIDSPSSTSLVTYNFEVNRFSSGTTEVTVSATGDHLPRVVVLEIPA